MNPDGSSPTTEQQIIQAAFAGDTVALQWYLLTHPGAATASGVSAISLSPSGASVYAGGNTLVILAVIAAIAIVVLK